MSQVKRAAEPTFYFEMSILLVFWYCHFDIIHLVFVTYLMSKVLTQWSSLIYNYTTRARVYIDRLMRAGLQNDYTEMLYKYKNWTFFGYKGKANATFLFYFFVKKYLLVGASSMLWTGQWISQWVSEWEMYACHTNQIGFTINSQSKLLS